jgi:DNA modification methylase
MIAQYKARMSRCFMDGRRVDAPSWYGQAMSKPYGDITSEREGHHPTMKPVAFDRARFQNSSKSGDDVLDLFGGSGSTMIACEKTNAKHG